MLNLHKSPNADKPTPKTKRSEVFNRYLTLQEEKLFFANMAKQKGASIINERDYWMFRLMRETAIRVNPLAHLTVGQAKEALKTARLHIGEFNKRRKEQDIYANKSALTALSNLLKINRKMNPSFCDESRLLISRNKSGITARSIQFRAKRWGKEVGLSDITPHWFRHTWAKRKLDEKGAQDPGTLRKIQAVLGHSDIKTTSIYTDPSKEDLEEFMQ